MKRLCHAVMPLFAVLALLFSTQAEVVASTESTLPDWGNHTDQGLKSGPLGMTSDGSPGETPIAISIPDADVDAEVEKNKIVDGKMLDPSGPWVVSWYQETGLTGDRVDYRNMVVSGHIDYWDVGPSVFQSVSALKPGALVYVTGEQGTVFTYAVASIEQVPAVPSAAQMQEIAGRSKTPILTIITCGGTFDEIKGEYPERTIVRANLIDSAALGQ